MKGSVSWKGIWIANGKLEGLGVACGGDGWEIGGGG